jgi:hypothetical protein
MSGPGPLMRGLQRGLHAVSYVGEKVKSIPVAPIRAVRNFIAEQEAKNIRYQKQQRKFAKEAAEKSAQKAAQDKIQDLYNGLQNDNSVTEKFELKDGLDNGTYTNILAYNSTVENTRAMVIKLKSSKILVDFFKKIMTSSDENLDNVLLNKLKLQIIRINLKSLHDSTTVGSSLDLESRKSATFNRKIIFKGIPGRDPTAIFDFQDLTTLYDDENNSTPDKWTYKLKKYNCSLLVCENISLPWEEIAANLDKISIYVKDSPEEVSGTTGGKRKTRRNKKMRSKKSRKNIKKRVNKKY